MAILMETAASILMVLVSAAVLLVCVKALEGWSCAPPRAVDGRRLVAAYMELGVPETQARALVDAGGGRVVVTYLIVPNE